MSTSSSSASPPPPPQAASTTPPAGGAASPASAQSRAEEGAGAGAGTHAGAGADVTTGSGAGNGTAVSGKTVNLATQKRAMAAAAALVEAAQERVDELTALRRTVSASAGSLTDLEVAASVDAALMSAVQSLAKRQTQRKQVAARVKLWSTAVDAVLEARPGGVDAAGVLQVPAETAGAVEDLMAVVLQQREQIEAQARQLKVQQEQMRTQARLMLKIRNDMKEAVETSIKLMETSQIALGARVAALTQDNNALRLCYQVSTTANFVPDSETTFAELKDAVLSPDEALLPLHSALEALARTPDDVINAILAADAREVCSAARSVVARGGADTATRDVIAALHVLPVFVERAASRASPGVGAGVAAGAAAGAGGDAGAGAAANTGADTSVPEATVDGVHVYGTVVKAVAEAATGECGDGVVTAALEVMESLCKHGAAAAHIRTVEELKDVLLPLVNGSSGRKRRAATSLWGRLLAMGVVAPDAAKWRVVCDSGGWAGRTSHALVSLANGTVLVVGGYGGNTQFRDIWKSDDGGSTWSHVCNAPWSARYRHAVAVHGSSVVLAGGFDGEYKHDVWSSTDGGETWSCVAGAAPWAGRYRHSLVALPSSGKLLVLGGGAQGVNYNDVWSSSDSGATWEKVCAEAPWSKRNCFGAIVMPNNDVIVMGGYSRRNMNDVWRSSDEGVTWTCVTESAPWTPRSGLLAVALPGSRIAVLGGFHARRNLNDVWLSDDGGATWRMACRNAAWPALSAAAATVLTDTGAIVLAGGKLAGAGRMDKVWSCTLEWTQQNE